MFLNLFGRNWEYFKYVMRHKWYVFVAAERIHASLISAIFHDISKFLPSEWIPYSKTFYTEAGHPQYKPSDDFDRAWLKHQNRNKHHWHYWILEDAGDESRPLEIPYGVVCDMVADWAGAGRSLRGEWEVKKWYADNKHKMYLHENTQLLIERILNQFF